MGSFISRWLATAVAVGAALWLVPGIELYGDYKTWLGVALFALVLSLVDMFVKPIFKVLSLPITVITLGIFYLFINTIMLYLASGLANGIFEVGFSIASFGSAFVASIVISIVGAIMNGILGTEKE